MASQVSGIGWQFPVQIDGTTGAVRMTNYEQDIEQSIRIILFTARGERVMRPDFGCGIHDLVFEDMNTTTLGLVESAVRESLVRWEPRIEVRSVSAAVNPAAPGHLTIELLYRNRITNETAGTEISVQLKDGQTA